MATDDDTNRHKQQILALYHQQGVEDLFDEYADTFDEHLTKGLRYNVPNVLLSQLQKVIPPQTTFRRCLDLGCGTGLAGVAFRDCCTYLEGVDISSAMVAKTRERGVYDKAEKGTLLSHMIKQSDGRFDIVISADVFMYVLDLRAVFKAVERVLSGDGWFVFSTEVLGEEEDGSEEGFVRRESDRFAHTRKFVLSLAEASTFDALSVENVALRMDDEAEIRGDIFVFRRNTNNSV